MTADSAKIIQVRRKWRNTDHAADMAAQSHSRGNVFLRGKGSSVVLSIKFQSIAGRAAAYKTCCKRVSEGVKYRIFHGSTRGKKVLQKW